jgi:hypothetical protein
VAETRTGSEVDVEGLLRNLDLRLEPEGWHGKDSDARVWYVRRTPGGRLRAKQANLPSMDGHPTLPATEVFYKLAKLAGHAWPADAVGAAFSFEMFTARLPKDAGVAYADQFHTARRAREVHRLPGAREGRTIAVVLRDGTEGGLMRVRDGEVTWRVGPQWGLVYAGLRLLCGLPEDDPEGAPDWEVE